MRGESRRAFFANADADTLVVHCRSSGRTYICIHCIHLPTFQPISICISAVQTFPFKRHYASHLVTAQRPTASRKTLRAVVPAIIGYSWTNLGTACTTVPTFGPRAPAPVSKIPLPPPQVTSPVSGDWGAPPNRLATNSSAPKLGTHQWRHLAHVASCVTRTPLGGSSDGLVATCFLNRTVCLGHGATGGSSSTQHPAVTYCSSPDLPLPGIRSYITSAKDAGIWEYHVPSPSAKYLLPPWYWG